MAVMKPFPLRRVEHVPVVFLGDFQKLRYRIARAAHVNHETVTRVIFTNIEFERITWAFVTAPFWIGPIYCW